MKKMLLLGMAALISSAAMAYPTLTGPSGLATLPDATVTPAGQVQLAADWYNLDDSAVPVRATYGITNNWEVGAAYWNQSDVNAWGLNAKYATPLTLGGFAWSAGAQFLNADDGDLLQAYFVGTQAFDLGGVALDGTLGVNWTDTDADSGFRLYGGLGTTFANNLSLAVEAQTKDSDIETDAVTSIVARYPFTESLSGQVGFSNSIATLGSDNHEIFAGVNYTFGGSAE